MKMKGRRVQLGHSVECVLASMRPRVSPVGVLPMLADARRWNGHVAECCASPWASCWLEPLRGRLPPLCPSRPPVATANPVGRCDRIGHFGACCSAGLCASTMVAKKGGGVRPTTRDLDVKLTRNYAVIVLLSALGVGLSITEVC